MQGIKRNSRLARMTMAFMLSAHLLFSPSVFAMEHATASANAHEHTGDSPVTILPNGLRVLFLEERGFPMVSCQMWYHVGSVDDPMGASGLCHVVEHVLTDVIRKNGGKLAKELVCIGGKFDAFTSDDFTVFVENVSSKHLDLALNLQLNRIHPPALTDADVERAKQEVLKEVEVLSQPNERSLNREVRALAFSRHPYKNLPVGFSDEIKHVSLHAVSHFMKTHFNPSNATLVLTGDFDHAKASALIKMKFGHVPAGGAKVHENLPVEPRQMGEKRVYINSGNTRTHLLVAFRGPQASDNDAPGTTVLESLLGDETDGLLKEVFVDSNLCDRTEAAFELRRHPGVITISLRGKSGVPEARLLAGLDQLCEKISRGSFDNDQLEVAKSRAVFKCLKNRSGPYGTAFQMGFFDALCKSDESKRWPTKLHSVDRGGVLQVANKYLQKSNRSLGFLVAKPAPPPPTTPAKTTSVKQVISYRSLRSIPDRPFLNPMSCASYSGDMVELVPMEHDRNRKDDGSMRAQEDALLMSPESASLNIGDERILLAKADESAATDKKTAGTTAAKKESDNKSTTSAKKPVAKASTDSQNVKDKLTNKSAASKPASPASDTKSASAPQPIKSNGKPASGQAVGKDVKATNAQAAITQKTPVKQPAATSSMQQNKPADKTAAQGKVVPAANQGKPVTTQGNTALSGPQANANKTITKTPAATNSATTATQSRPATASNQNNTPTSQAARVTPAVTSTTASTATPDSAASSPDIPKVNSVSSTSTSPYVKVYSTSPGTGASNQQGTKPGTPSSSNIVLQGNQSALQLTGSSTPNSVGTSRPATNQAAVNQKPSTTITGTTAATAKPGQPVAAGTTSATTQKPNQPTPAKAAATAPATTQKPGQPAPAKATTTGSASANTQKSGQTNPVKATTAGTATATTQKPGQLKPGQSAPAKSATAATASAATQKPGQPIPAKATITGTTAATTQKQVQAKPGQPAPTKAGTTATTSATTQKPGQSKPGQPVPAKTTAGTTTTGTQQPSQPKPGQPTPAKAAATSTTNATTQKPLQPAASGTASATIQKPATATTATPQKPAQTTPAKPPTTTTAATSSPNQTAPAATTTTTIKTLTPALTTPPAVGSTTSATTQPSTQSILTQPIIKPTETAPSTIYPAEDASAVNQKPQTPTHIQTTQERHPVVQTSAPATHDYTQVLKLDHRLSEAKLQNGIRLIVHTVKSSPIIQIAGCTAAGSPYEPPDKSGVAELNVELMNGDSTKITRENSVKHQQRSGLSAKDLINVELDREYIKFQAACSVSDFEQELKLLTHHLVSPLLTEESLKAAKSRVATKVKKRFETADDNTERLLLSSIVDKNSSFAPMSPRTQMTSTEQITMDDVSAFRAATMSPTTTTIVVSGNITLQAATAAVTAAFRDWRTASHAPRAVLLPEKRRVTKVTVPTESGTSVKMAVGKLLHIPADNTRILVADCVLSTHPLYARLLDLKHRQANKSLHMTSDIVPLSNSCAWVLNLDVPDLGVRDASNTLKSKLQVFSRDGISAFEFEEAKKFVVGQTAVSRLNSVENSARSIVDSIIASGSPSTIFQTDALASSLKLELINKFIRDEFQPSRSCMVAVGEKKAIRQLATLSSN